jgi:GT2 family glycosyltransferase
VFFFASADMFYNPGDLEMLASASPEEITLHGKFPHWQTFAIGEKVVDRIGLFDEALHPIYFEDTDYLRRAAAEKVTVRYKEMTGGHDNSSTIAKSKHYSNRNSATFADNQNYYENKVAADDFSEGRWQLRRTRNNSWAK